MTRNLLKGILMPVQSYASKFVKRYHIVVSCALKMEHLISDHFCKFRK